MGKQKAFSGLWNVLKRALSQEGGYAFERAAAQKIYKESGETITREASHLMKKGLREAFDVEHARVQKLASQDIELNVLDAKVSESLRNLEKDLRGYMESDNFEAAMRVARRTIKDDKTVSELLQKRDFKAIKELSANKVFKESIDTEIKLREDEVRWWLGDDDVNKMLTESTSRLDYADKLYKAHITGHDLLNKNGDFKKKGLVGQIGDLFGDLNTKSGDIYGKLMDDGRIMAAGVVKKIHSLNSKSDGLTGKLSDLFGNAGRELSDRGEVKAKMIRTYIENFRMDPQFYKKGGVPNGKAVKGDWDLVNQINSQIQDASQKLNVEDIELANKVVNSFRHSKKAEVMWSKNKVYDHSEVPLWKQLSGEEVLNAKSFGEGDLGVNYFHAQGTKEFFERMRKHDPSLLAQMGIDDADQYQRAFSFTKMRKAQSELTKNPMNRLNPWEELDHYHRSYVGQVVKKEFNSLKNELHRTLLLDIHTGDNPYKDIIAPLEKHLNNKLASKSFNAWSDMGKFEKTAYSMINLDITAALTSPRMFFFNAPQLMATGSNNKGFFNSFSSILQTYGSFLKAMLSDPKGVFNAIKNPNEINEIFHNIANNKTDPFVKSLFDRMLNEHPEFYKITLPFDSSMAANKLQKLSQVFLLPFQASDKVARLSMFTAAINKGKQAHAKLVKNINGGMKKGDALKQFSKDAHLGEFDEITIEKLVDSLNLKDLKNNKEFLYQYGSASIYAEGFNYGKSGAPFLKDWANAQHPLLGMAFTFQTWNMFYTGLIKGAIRSYKNGDPKPAAMLALLGTGWYIGSQIAASSDNDFIADYGRYAAGRTPLYLPTVGLFETAFRKPAGIMEPIIRGAEFPLVGGMKFVNDVIFPNAKSNSIDYTYKQALHSLKNTIARKRLEGIYENAESLVETIRENGLIIDF